MKRVLIFAALALWSGLASAVVYKWIDAQGKLQYGDRPPDGVHAEVVEGLGHPTTHAPPVRAVSSGPTGQPARPAGNPGTPADSAAKQAVADDVAAAKDKQCADAQDHYKRLIEGRRLYKEGANGERQYLTAEEIDSERLSAKQELDTVCNSPT